MKYIALLALITSSTYAWESPLVLRGSAAVVSPFLISLQLFNYNDLISGNYGKIMDQTVVTSGNWNRVLLESRTASFLPTVATGGPTRSISAPEKELTWLYRIMKGSAWTIALRSAWTWVKQRPRLLYPTSAAFLELCTIMERVLITRRRVVVLRMGSVRDRFQSRPKCGVPRLWLPLTSSCGSKSVKRKWTAWPGEKKVCLT